MELKGKKVLVTGGSSGIGYAIAEHLGQKGALVGINGRDASRLEDAAKKLDCPAFAGDVGDEEQAESIVSAFVERLGGIDVLINNAGFGIFSKLVDMKTEDFEAVIRTNVTGCFLVGRAVARHLLAQSSGAIVNVASTAALKGFQGGTAYATSKFALRGMTECWREELRRHDIRVMLVNPSEVITDFSKRAGYEQEVTDKKLRPSEIAEAVVSMLEMNERGFIPELAVFATNPF